MPFDHHSFGARADRPESSGARRAAGLGVNGILDALLHAALADQAECDSDSPLAEVACEFFMNNWTGFRDNLLQKTKILRVRPLQATAPTMFDFELDRPYKRQTNPGAPIELVPGPIRGTIFYRANLFEQPDGDYVAVQVDPRLHYYHPNCAPRHGSRVCLGYLPETPFPLPLDMLVENHVYPILTYQNMTPSDPLNQDAAMYFALADDPLCGLVPVPPLYDA